MNHFEDFLKGAFVTSPIGHTLRIRGVTIDKTTGMKIFKLIQLNDNSPP
jgi:hypothetical protein